MLTSNEIRSRFLQFFETHGHAIVPSAPLVPENDPSTLFTGSGMQPMIPYFFGEPHPLGRRVVNSQKSFRAQDIEEVGDNRHTTFFEMLGNWSFGDYFKEEQIPWMFAFLTEEIGLDPHRLYFTCYQGNESLGIPRDTRAAELWQSLLAKQGVEATIIDNAEENGLQGGRIFYYGDKKNWWSRSGVPDRMPVGEPGGPDTEMFFDFGPELPSIHERSLWKDTPCHVNCDCGRFIEIGNNVFMEYVKTADGFEKLPKPNVDFGGGLERLLAAKLKNPDVFMTEPFADIRKTLEQLSEKTYGADESKTRSFRIVMDHLRAATFLICDGVFPSNTDRGYVLRRLLRRAIRFADLLGVPTGHLADLSKLIVTTYTEAYPQLGEHAELISSEIHKEETKFRNTLAKGLREFERRVTGGTLTGKDAFDLFTTYGFPYEMTQELATEQGIQVNEIEFQQEFEKHRELSRTASAGKFKGGLADHSAKVTAMHTTTHLMLAALRHELGEHVHQAGSNITEKRIRFDFTHPERVSRDVLDRVETAVNTAIEASASVTTTVIDKEVAQTTGIEGSFWEKYPDKVTVYQVEGPDGSVYSRELCGGPHVGNTHDIAPFGQFKIIKEEASSAGVRRIKAVLA